MGFHGLVPFYGCHNTRPHEESWMSPKIFPRRLIIQLISCLGELNNSRGWQTECWIIILFTKGTQKYRANERVQWMFRNIWQFLDYSSASCSVIWINIEMFICFPGPQFSIIPIHLLGLSWRPGWRRRIEWRRMTSEWEENDGATERLSISSRQLNHHKLVHWRFSCKTRD